MTAGGLIILALLGAPESPVEGRPLTLVEAIEDALRNNLDLEIARFTPLTAEQDIVRAYGAFDLILSGSATARDTRQPSASALVTGSGAPLEQQAINYAVGVRQTLPVGLRYTLNVTADRTTSNSTFALLDPRWDTAVNLAVTMPFLQGNSRQLHAPILVARHRQAASLHDFEVAMVDLVVSVENAYWRLYGLQQERRVREQSLETARELLRLNTERFDAGLDPRIEVTRAESEVATRVEALITTRNAIADATDELMRLVDPETLRRGGRLEFRLMDGPPERPESVDADALLEQIVREAGDARAELASLRRQEQAQEASAEQARIAALPRLDLTAGSTAFGLDRNFSRSWYILGREDFTDLSVALALEFPLANFAARADRRHALLEMRRLQVRRTQMEDTIRLEVRRAVRGLQTNAERMEATSASLELAAQRYDMEEARRDAGFETSLGAMEALEELELARLNHLQARIDYQLARVQLERAGGTVLSRRHIVAEDHLAPRLSP